MQKTLGIYQSYLCKIGGVETFLYNLCYNLRNYYDITLVYRDGDSTQIQRLRRLVKLEKYNSKPRFEFDIVIRNSVWGEIPNKIFSKDNRYIEIRHADYKWLKDRNILDCQVKAWDKTNDIIACGDHVANMSRLVMHDNPKVIKNILLPNKKPNKILHFISFTRLDGNKGWDRMLTLCSMLKSKNIKFTWDIYTNDKKNCSFKEVRFNPTTLSNERFDYIADADYCVLLSDSEGLPYTVQEALQYDTPCIVTDVPGCTELIQDGVNGYVVPLDMNFDVNKLLNIPKISNYDNHAFEDWLKYLGDAEYKECPKLITAYKVRATEAYKNLNLVDAELGYIPLKGTEWIVSLERFTELNGNNRKGIKFVELVEKIYE